MRIKSRLYFSTTILILFILIIYSLSIGESHLGFIDTLFALLGQGNEFTQLIVQDIRLPRILVALIGGAALGLSGLLLQTLTSNPLADSSLLGVNTGAGFVVTLLAITTPFGEGLTFLLMPIFAILGAYGTLLLIYYVSLDSEKKVKPFRLIITGVGIATMMSGLMVSFVGNVNRYKMTYVINWLSGQINGDNWETIFLICPLITFLILLAYSQSLPFNIMLLNEESAQSLGIHLNQKRQLILLISTSLSALSIIMIGNITFIGLIAAHISRIILGPNHRLLIPSTLLMGSLILLVADTISRVFLVGSTIPTGLIVALIGAPYFIYLLSRYKI